MTRNVGFDHNGGPHLDDSPSTMGGEGWVAVRREMRAHYLVGFGKTVTPQDPERGFVYSRAEAWLDLIMECRYKEGTVMNGGKKMELKPGQLTGARSWLAHRWNWTPKAVRWFLETLEEEGMIERSSPGVSETRQMPDGILNSSNKGQQKGKQSQVITICNYSNYQFVKDIEGPAKGQAEGQQGASKGPARGQNLIKEERKKEEESCPNDAVAQSDVDATPDTRKPKSAYPEQFETFWIGYPDRTNNSKAAALAAWKQMHPDDRAAAIRSLPQFARYCRENPTYRALHAERYLRQKRFEAHLTNVASPATYGGGESPWWANAKIVKEITPERWKKAISKFANGIWPVDKLGPPPGDPSCVVPNELIEELQLKSLYDASGKRI